MWPGHRPYQWRHIHLFLCETHRPHPPTLPCQHTDGCHEKLRLKKSRGRRVKRTSWSHTYADKNCPQPIYFLQEINGATSLPILSKVVFLFLAARGLFKRGLLTDASPREVKEAQQKLCPPPPASSLPPPAPFPSVGEGWKRSERNYGVTPTSLLRLTLTASEEGSLLA